MNYKALKNFIHNEIKLSKNDLVKMAKEAAIIEGKSLIRKKINSMTDEQWSKLFKDILRHEVKSTLNSYGFKSDKLYRSLAETIGDKIEIKIKE